MQPKVQLSIPQPCHEDWQKMTPSQQGRFCNACAKQVVDFTNMSDTEVLHYFLDKKGEKVCGRMYPDQLNRPVTKKVHPLKKKWWQWNYAALFLFMFQKTNASVIHGGLDIKHTMMEKKPVSFKDLYHFSKDKLLAQPKKITGKITDKYDSPIAGASIIIKGTTSATTSDQDGQYHLTVNTENDILVISAIGFEKKEINLKNEKSYDTVLTALTPQLLGDVVVVGGVTSADYDYTSANPRHIAVIEVLDNATHEPVKATLHFNKAGYKKDTATTDVKGIYKLKRVSESDKFTVTIKAAGYLPAELDIKGWAFNERKERKYVFLEKTPELSDFKKLKSITVESYTMGKICRYTVGSVSAVKTSCSRTIQDSLNQFKTKLTSSLKIAPSPVIKGSALTIWYTTKQSGNYLMQVTNAAGQIILQKQITAMQKSNSVQIQTSTGWGSGVYYIKISTEKNNLISTNSFIVQ
jgi:hypothetical protein